jgi:hypothetical protein
MQIAVRLCHVAVVTALVSGTASAFPQEPSASPAPSAQESPQQISRDTVTRQSIIERAQAAKAEVLHPIVLSRGERVMNKAEAILDNRLTWHPYFDSAYAGGGLPFGLGYRRHVSPYNVLDVRGSSTMRGYTRLEAEFTAPRLFQHRSQLSLLGGWREATAVRFYGVGHQTVTANPTSYGFRQPYVSATLRAVSRRPWAFEGSLEWTTWNQQPGQGRFRSVDTRFTPETLPGLGADVTYIHTQATVGLDWRPSPGYTRRGGYYGVTAHDYTNTNGNFGFTQIDYEAIQHIPILRETWVVTLRGAAQTTSEKDGDEIPFFMLPSLGGGKTLRGFSSWRLRDRNSLLLQAEWRTMVNRFLDAAIFYDTGKVAAHLSELDLRGLRHDWGIGFRVHSPDVTVLRIDVARSREGTRLVFAAGHVF